MASGITLTEIDPATLPTPDAGKDTIFMDATASPPAPAFIDSSGIVTSLIGPAGPEGPAGPSGSITVNPNGALDGDGSGGSPLGVRVDGVTVTINASNELESVGGSATVSVAPNAALDGDGSVPSPLAVLFDNETIGVDSTNKLQVIAPYIPGPAVRRGLTYSGGYLDVNVDNETIGIDSQDKLQVIQNYLRTGGPLGTPSSGTLTNCVGTVVQVVNTQTGAVATGSTVIPHDDTIPQSNEGDEYMTLAITPTKVNNKLKIEVVFFASATNTNQWMTAALFQDANVNALACGAQFNATATGGVLVVFTHYMTAGTTASTTFKVRGGRDTSGTTTFNGQSSGRTFGGVMASSITITEIAA